MSRDAENVRCPHDGHRWEIHHGYHAGDCPFIGCEWFMLQANRAEKRLRSMSPADLGMAGRILLGLESWSGEGTGVPGDSSHEGGFDSRPPATQSDGPSEGADHG